MKWHNRMVLWFASSSSVLTTAAVRFGCEHGKRKLHGKWCIRSQANAHIMNWLKHSQSVRRTRCWINLHLLECKKGRMCNVRQVSKQMRSPSILRRLAKVWREQNSIRMKLAAEQRNHTKTNVKNRSSAENEYDIISSLWRSTLLLPRARCGWASELTLFVSSAIVAEPMNVIVDSQSSRDAKDIQHTEATLLRRCWDFSEKIKRKWKISVQSLQLVMTVAQRHWDTGWSMLLWRALAWLITYAHTWFSLRD